MENKNYKPRLIDDKVGKYLRIFGAISIEGPKWCGKTWTSLKFAESVSYLSDEKIRAIANTNPTYIFDEKRPQLIDEWQLAPCVWDAVRHECDMTTEKGNFILTGSTTLEKDDEDKVKHSGAGRIATLKMYPMSLYESGDSCGKISILDMYENKNINEKVEYNDLEKTAYLILRGGWPANIGIGYEDASVIPESYITAFLTKDIHERKDKRRDSNRMQMILRSLARNESSLASQNTILEDIADNSSNETIENRITLTDYLSVLDDLYLTNNHVAYSVNYRSSSRVGKTSKRHFIDPSLACAILGLSSKKLIYDMKTFGFMFESLVYRDLCIYMNYLDGKVYHFRDNVSGDEVDAILEFKDGNIGAVEIKLNYEEDSIASAKKSLLTFSENSMVKPKFLCIIVSGFGGTYKDEETGIYLVPINALKP